MSKLKCVWMKNLRENLQRFDQAWPGAIEELIAVRDKHPAIAHRAQFAPTCVIAQGHQTYSMKKTESRREHFYHIWIPLASKNYA